MQRIHLTSLLAGSMLTLSPFNASAQQADLPCNTAQLILPWAPGGDTDIIFRAVAEAANEAGADPQIQVVNVAGQGGTQGARQGMDAAPDGCTLTALHESVFTSFLTGVVDFTWDDFAPVALISRSPSIVGAVPDAPYDDMEGLIEAAEANPGSINVGATLGSTSHFIFLIIEDRTGAKFKYVPYEGTRDRLTALLAGNVELAEMNVITAKQYLAENSVKALGIATAERDPALPDLLTLAEQGIEVQYGTSRGVAAPLGTPPEAVAYWEGIFEQAMNDPELVELLASQGTTVDFQRSEEYAQTLSKAFDEHKTAAINLGIYRE